MSQTRALAAEKEKLRLMQNAADARQNARQPPEDRPPNAGPAPGSRASQHSVPEGALSASPSAEQQQLPLTPAQALRMYKGSMSMYEQGEVLDFPEVYFVGQNATKVRASANAGENNGFDDERGDYIWSTHDHIAFRYEILGVLGKGSFGVVTKCYDWKTKQIVALKIIRNKKRFHQQALVEVKLLEHPQA